MVCRPNQADQMQVDLSRTRTPLAKTLLSTSFLSLQTSLSSKVENPPNQNQFMHHTSLSRSYISSLLVFKYQQQAENRQNQRRALCEELELKRREGIVFMPTQPADHLGRRRQ